jgi:hypothetical protein
LNKCFLGRNSAILRGFTAARKGHSFKIHGVGQPYRLPPHLESQPVDVVSVNGFSQKVTKLLSTKDTRTWLALTNGDTFLVPAFDAVRPQMLFEFPERSRRDFAETHAAPQKLRIPFAALVIGIGGLLGNRVIMEH